jgi:hypothetical protein
MRRTRRHLIGGGVTPAAESRDARTEWISYLIAQGFYVLDFSVSVKTPRARAHWGRFFLCYLEDCSYSRS